VTVLGVLRLFFAVVAIVAGVAGVVMLAAPADSGDYFSWPIGPPPLTTLVGAFYVASSVVFGIAALRIDWPAVRGLCVGVLALTVPTLVATARHHEVFDFDRIQAIAWVLLFVASPCAYGTVLFLQRGQVTEVSRPRLAPWARTIAGLLAIAYLAAAAWCWSDPSGAGEQLPFALPALSGAFIGCWSLFLATLAAFSWRRPSVREARLPLLALTLWPLAGVLAGLRSFDDLAASRRAGYLAVLATLAVLAAAALSAARTRDVSASGGG
jgi:hypothetical protein